MVLVTNPLAVQEKVLKIALKEIYARPDSTKLP
jgi:hypothetical protein